MDDGFQLCQLEAVHHKVDGTLLLTGVIAPGLNLGDAAAELIGNSLADLRSFRGDDHERLGLVQTFHNKVHRLNGHGIGGGCSKGSGTKRGRIGAE